MKNSKLALSQSLYLKQHFDSPIDWHTWSNEAFDMANKDKKVIFISIGYSSCHWCHVMNHESFSSLEVADYLNENFISIKVDREEHPDIDQYFQKMAQLMNKQGGWPLSIFLTPEKKPIFIGTYFPLQDRTNVPSFLSLTKEIIKYYALKKQDIINNAIKVEDKIKEQWLPKENVQFEGHFPSATSILKALQAYGDVVHGGYGKAPKFPQFSFWEAVIEQCLEGVVPKELFDHIIFSIEKMTFGGIIDQVRGGIHRYSTDEKWLVPHFEKMIYDQAGLLRVLSKFSLINPSPQVFDLIYLTLDYLSIEMVHDEGYFLSSQDADSEGVEGLYFSFTEEEFEDAIVRFDENLITDLNEVKSWFGISKNGNFEHQLNIISLNYDKRSDFFKEENWIKVRKIKKALLETRKTRIPPSTDNKGISGWNFMMLSALCDVIQYTRVAPIKSAAEQLLSKVQQNIETKFLNIDKISKTFKITHTTTLDQFTLYFEDYVFFMEAQWRLYQLSGDNNFILNIRSTLNLTIDLFVKNYIVYTTNKYQDQILENVPFPSFDQSYRSALSTFYHLLLKMRVFDLNPNSSELEENIKKHLRQWSLYNPLGHGEALRVLIYPELAYKKISVPKEWIKNKEFLNFISYFSHRFVFSYTDDSSKWEICHMKGCEAIGNTFEEFKNTLTLKNIPSQ